jgi:hypothetical protein
MLRSSNEVLAKDSILTGCKDLGMQREVIANDGESCSDLSHRNVV